MYTSFSAIGSSAAVGSSRITTGESLYSVFNMGHRMEIYVRPEVADKVIAISQQFNIDAQVIGHIEEGKRSLTIKSEYGEFNY